MLRSWILAGSLAVLLAGCKTAGPVQQARQDEAPDAGVAAPPPVPDRPIAVDLKVEAMTRKGQGFIDSEEILRSGDKLALHLVLSDPAYVYVGLLAADGSKSVVFPKEGHQILSAGIDHRIPALGQWFKLDRDTGREDIFVYASRKPLASEQTLALLDQDAARVRQAKAPKVKHPKRPSGSQGDDGPGALSPDTRGLDVVSDEQGQAKADPNLTRAHFPIRHKK